MNIAYLKNISPCKCYINQVKWVINVESVVVIQFSKSVYNILLQTQISRVMTMRTMQYSLAERRWHLSSVFTIIIYMHACIVFGISGFKFMLFSHEVVRGSIISTTSINIYISKCVISSFFYNLFQIDRNVMQ